MTEITSDEARIILASVANVALMAIGEIPRDISWIDIADNPVDYLEMVASILGKMSKMIEDDPEESRQMMMNVAIFRSALDQLSAEGNYGV